MVTPAEPRPVVFIGGLDGPRWVPMSTSDTGLPAQLWMPGWPADDAPAVPVLYNLHRTVFGGRWIPVYVSGRVPRVDVQAWILGALLTPEAFEAWHAAEPVPREAPERG